MATHSRRPVADGGAFFSTQKPSFSKETQDLLKLMMKESQLTNFQQRKLKETMMNGQALPSECLPTSSSRGGGRGDHGRTPAGKKKKKTVGAEQRGLRSKETIEKLSADDLSHTTSYRPPPQKYNVTREKQRLQNLMTYGKSDIQQTPASQTSTKQDPTEDENDTDRFEEILGEIEERRQFLADMEALGEGKDHHAKIMTEISQRVRELETIDRERTTQLMDIQKL